VTFEVSKRLVKSFPYFSNRPHSFLLYAISIFPTRFHASRNDGINAKSFHFVLRKILLHRAGWGGGGLFLTEHFFCDWRVTRSLFQIDCALNYYNTHFLHITLHLTKSQLTFPLLNCETSYRGSRIKTLNNFSVRRSPLLSIIFTA